jgi:hypothetical protein
LENQIVFEGGNVGNDSVDCVIDLFLEDLAGNLFFGFFVGVFVVVV